MAAGFLITRLFCVLSCMNYSSVFSTAEHIVPEEVVQKAYHYLNEKLPQYIQSKQPEFAQLLGHLVKLPSEHQQTKSPIQQQPQASVPLTPQNAPFSLPQNYISHLLSLSKLGSVIEGSDAGSSPKPIRFQIQDWIGSTDHKNPTYHSNPQIRLSVTIPGTHDHLDKGLSHRLGSLASLFEKLELAKEKQSETEKNQAGFFHRPGHYQSLEHPYHPRLEHNQNPQDNHNLAHPWPHLPIGHPFGHHDHPTGPRVTSHHEVPKPQSQPHWVISQHDSGDHRPQTQPHWAISHRGPGHQRSAHHKLISPPHWSVSHPGPRHYGPTHHKPQTPPQWLISNRGAELHGVRQHKPQSLPHRPNSYVQGQHQPPPHWLIFQAP